MAELLSYDLQTILHFADQEVPLLSSYLYASILTMSIKCSTESYRLHFWRLSYLPDRLQGQLLKIVLYHVHLPDFGNAV
jgi:hypothetical protein